MLLLLIQWPLLETAAKVHLQRALYQPGNVKCNALMTDATQTPHRNEGLKTCDLLKVSGGICDPEHLRNMSLQKVFVNTRFENALFEKRHPV
ncbi:hypothetical protein NPIL_662401 [Nephila pilipes]|uniref:Uncharacterized protein n=1 Tax=Nephila pilipes TaxID=299642 RepID=A0A8X6TF57_NEPPI|nr:hypothetical protein NPIL_662401 [Nephila pilipes]